MTACLLVLDGAEETEEVNKHNAVGQLGLVVEPVNLSPILWYGGEGKDIVEIETEGLVYVVDESLDVLLGSLVKGNDG